MTLLSTHVERKSLGRGRYRNEIHMYPIAYRDSDILQRIANDFADGDEQRPHIVTTAPLMASIADNCARRLHPTREIDRYLEIGAPYIKPAGIWQQVNLGQPVRNGNLLTWTTANADVYIRHGGHFVKLAILLKNGWQPPNGQFAFPVDLVGLDRLGSTILTDGQPVMQVRVPHVEDYDNPHDVRPIDWNFVRVNGQWFVLFTLPDLAGMVRPLIDPTLTLQPAEVDGQDTYLFIANPTTNYGTNAVLGIGEGNWGLIQYERSLLKFDLSSIPVSATVTSATLSLWLQANGNAWASNNRTIQMYRVLRDWVEAQATWNIYKTANNWGTAGCSNTTTDREATGIGSKLLSMTDLASSQHDFTLTPGVGGVQDWVRGTLANNGMIGIADTELNDCYVFHSSNSVTAGFRPRLTVEYVENGGMDHRFLCPSA